MISSEMKEKNVMSCDYIISVSSETTDMKQTDFSFSVVVVLQWKTLK